MEQTKSSNNIYIVVIGIGVFVCLIVLAIISWLDLNQGPSSPDSPNLAPFNDPAQSTSICPNCGTEGIPQCLYCGSSMCWNGSMEIYSCPRCQRFGPANCPQCGIPMRPQTITPLVDPPSANQNGTLVALPCPGACPGCPLGAPQTGNQQIACPLPTCPVAWNPLTNGLNGIKWVICPNCGYRVFQQLDSLINNITCPGCQMLIGK